MYGASGQVWAQSWVPWAIAHAMEQEPHAATWDHVDMELRCIETWSSWNYKLEKNYQVQGCPDYKMFRTWWSEAGGWAWPNQRRNLGDPLTSTGASIADEVAYLRFQCRVANTQFDYMIMRDAMEKVNALGGTHYTRPADLIAHWEPEQNC